MRGLPATLLMLLLASVAVAAAASGEEVPTREQYVAAVEPICERNIAVSQRILKGVRGKIRRKEFDRAGAQFIRVSEAFGDTVRELVAVARPPADDARLLKWFRFLRIVRSHLRNVGKSLKAGDEIKATHDRIRAERSSNAANNVSFVFGFRYCRLTRSRFR